jgi:two-component system response regulator RpaA
MSQTVLVIDDDPDICEIVRVNLEGAGYVVAVANDGAAGLQAAREVQPDLIVLDVLMPELDGWQVLEQLGNEPTTADVPVIMLTCKGEDLDILRGLSEGAVEYVTKPFYPENLAASVKIQLDVFDPSMRRHRRHKLIARRQRLIESATESS